MSWRDRAACLNSPDADAFFPEKGARSDRAKAICRRCPVRAPCLDYAQRTEERFGVWGGLSERERRRLRRRAS